MQAFKRRSGAVLLAVTISVILVAITIAVALPVASKEVQREKEDSLRFILGEFRRAVENFEHFNGRTPENIEELIVDQQGRKFLRKRYLDPFTGKFDWRCEKASATMSVFSASDDLSLAGMPYSDFR